MKYIILFLSFFLFYVSHSQVFVNRSGPSVTAQDDRLAAKNNLYLPRLGDTTLAGGQDTIGAILYDKSRAKVWIRDTVLTGGHKWTQFFKQDDTISVLATQYDLSQITGQDTTSLSNRINLKLNISDTVGKWLAQNSRIVDTIYRVNDSTVGFTIKGNPYTFQILGRSSGSSGASLNNVGTGYRWVVTAAGDIKSVSASNTILWDSTSTANTLTAKADTSILATQYDLTQIVSGINQLTGWVTAGPGTGSQVATLTPFRTYPDESSNWVTIYDKSSWSGADLGSEFQRGSNHTLSLNGVYPRIASSTIVWGGNSISRFLPNMPIIPITDSIVVEYQIVSALASNVGFGPSLYSNNVNGANFGYTTYLACASSTATPHFAKQDGTSDQSGTTFTVSQGDVIRQTIGFRDTVAFASFQNITTGSAISTITKSFTAGVAPYPPNTGTWAFQNFSGTYEIRRVKIMSRKTISPTLMTAFDSKGQIITTSWGARFPTLLNSRYPVVLNYSGGGDQLKDLIDKKVEFNRLNPEQILIGLGSNDLRYGSSLATTLDRLDKVIKMVSGSTTRWAVTVVPEDSTGGGSGGGIGLTAFKNAISALYPSNYIDLWTFMSTSNVLKSAYNGGDGIHPNTAGHRVIDSLVAASGFFSTKSPYRRTPYQRVAGGLAAIGDSLFGPFKVPLPVNSLLRSNDSSSIVPSLMFDNGTRLVASTNYQQIQSVAAATLLHVDGTISMTGTAGGFLLYDRTNTSNFHFLYSNNNALRFNYNGTDHSAIDATGRWAIGFDVNTQNIQGLLRIRKNYTYGVQSSAQGLALNIDTATYTTTAPGTVGIGAIASIGPSTLVGPGSPAIYTNMASLYIDGAPTSGSNMTFTNSWALYSGGGKNYFGGGLQSASGNYYKVNTVTNGTTGLDLTYYMILCDATSGNITLNLPSASTAFNNNTGIVYVFKRMDNTANTITINRNGSDTIDGGTSISITTQYEVKELICISSSAWGVK